MACNVGSMTDEESMRAAIVQEVELVEHDSEWSLAFDAEKERIEVLLPQTFLGIEHIGSTAIDGMPAKPVIDMLAGVESMERARALAEPLRQAGYSTSAEFNASLDDRQWFMRWRDGRRTHHLHVVEHGGAAWRDRLDFRDALRLDPWMAERYASLKRELAKQHRSDRKAYTDAKFAFVRDALVDVWSRRASR